MWLLFPATTLSLIAGCKLLQALWSSFHHQPVFRLNYRHKLGEARKARDRGWWMGGGGQHGCGWGETGQMFLEWDTGVIDADWNLKGEHSPRASCSGWKMGGVGALSVLPR